MHDEESKQEEHKKEKEDAFTDALKTLTNSNDLHVIYMGKKDIESHDLTDDDDDDESSKKMEVTQITATVFKLSESTRSKEDVNENQMPSSDNEKLSTLDLGSNLRKMFNNNSNTTAQQLGARPKEMETSVDIGESEKNKNETRKEKICWSCHTTEEEAGVKIAKCKGCRKARYCSEDCQATDWERHKTYCERIQEKRRRKGENEN